MPPSENCQNIPKYVEMRSAVEGGVMRCDNDRAMFLTLKEGDTGKKTLS
jgi:hypothetical protein